MANFVLRRIGQKDKYLNMYRLELVGLPQATLFPTRQIADLFCEFCNNSLRKKVYKVYKTVRDYKFYSMDCDDVPLVVREYKGVNLRVFDFLGLRFRLDRVGDAYLHSTAHREIICTFFRPEFGSKFYVVPIVIFRHACPQMHDESEYSRYFTNFCDNIRDIQDSYSTMPSLFADSDDNFAGTP